jgi:OmcA/MtrC family decaheme c-type cytochrome
MTRTTRPLCATLGAATLFAVLLPHAAFADKKALRAPDYNAVAPRTAAIFGPVGINVKILSAAIAKNGVITARVTITDSANHPLDRLGVYSAGPVSLSFICATIPAGQTQYFSYTTSVSNPTNTTNPPQIQAANDSGGTLTQNAIGDYTYTFHTLAPANFDATATHSIGVSAQRDLSAFGTYDEWSETSNDVFNFVPNGAPVTVTRSVVATAACNGCHDPLIGHGGSRLKVELCIMCHQPQTINTDTGLTQDMKVLIHKIHDGANLPSVIAGTPYRIWHRGAWSDFSAVVFPQSVENCTTCHTPGQAQSDNWKTNPSSAACGSCHDDVNFATGVNHVNLPVTDSQCKTCHLSTASGDFDASIPGAHVLPNNSASLPGIVMKVIGVTGAVPGSSPVVTFSVNDKSGNPVDISKITQIRVVLGGQNVDYGTGATGMRVSEDPSKTTGSNGVYTYTMTNKIPTGATGSYTISLEARNSVTLAAGTTKQVVASDNAVPVEYYISVDKSATLARRVVVATQKCAACHADLTFVHSGPRGNTQECVICHNPTLVDGTSKMSVNFAEQIHSIHRGSNLANPYILGTTNYQSVLFPGDLRDCATCHVNNSYQVDNVGAVAMVATTGSFMPTTAPIAAACLGCHDTADAASHALANTTTLGENCVICHGMTGAFSLDTVHAR